MQQEIELSALLKTIAQMEQELRLLRQQVLRWAEQQSESQPIKTPQQGNRPYRSLKGIFPPSNTTMADFREAREGWKRRAERQA